MNFTDYSFTYKRKIFIQRSTGIGIWLKHKSDYSIFITPKHVHRWKFNKLYVPKIREYRRFSVKHVFTSKDFKSLANDTVVVVTDAFGEFFQSIENVASPDIGASLKLHGYPQSKGGRKLEIREGEVKEITDKFVCVDVNTEIGFSGGTYVDDRKQNIAIHLGRKGKLAKGFRLDRVFGLVDEICEEYERS